MTETVLPAVGRHASRRRKDWGHADELLARLQSDSGLAYCENILENTWKLSDGRHGLFVGDRAVYSLPEEEVLAKLGQIEEVPPLQQSSTH